MGARVWGAKGSQRESRNLSFEEQNGGLLVVLQS